MIKEWLDHKRQTGGGTARGRNKVILSAPFKIKAKGLDMPDDAITTVMGINEDDYIEFKLNCSDAEKDDLTYKLISNPLYGKLFGNYNNYRYYPQINYHGKDSFKYSCSESF